MSQHRSLERRRRVTRRHVSLPCQVVTTQGFRLIGHHTLDMSPYGLLVEGTGPAELGEKVVVAFSAPHSEQWFDAEGEVVRTVNGRRRGDAGYAIGIRFTRFALASRLELRERLRGLPPPIPKRPLRLQAWSRPMVGLWSSAAP